MARRRRPIDLDEDLELATTRIDERLESARLLDPSLYWDQIRAGVLLINGDADAAAAQAEAVILAEPDNFAAWSLLRVATRRSDPRRSAQAERALTRLNPLTAR